MTFSSTLSAASGFHGACCLPVIFAESNRLLNRTLGIICSRFCFKDTKVWSSAELLHFSIATDAIPISQFISYILNDIDGVVSFGSLVFWTLASQIYIVLFFLQLRSRLGYWQWDRLRFIHMCSSTWKFRMWYCTLQVTWHHYLNSVLVVHLEESVKDIWAFGSNQPPYLPSCPFRTRIEYIHDNIW